VRDTGCGKPIQQQPKREEAMISATKKPPTTTAFACPAGSAWYPLWEHMHDNHGLILLDSEINDMLLVADEMRRSCNHQTHHAERRSSSMTEPILLACPFCGASAKAGRRPLITTGELHWLECTGCGVRQHGRNAEEARRCWNTRKDNAPERNA
jgi:hypothetical protein